MESQHGQGRHSVLHATRTLVRFLSGAGSQRCAASSMFLSCPAQCSALCIIYSISFTPHEALCVVNYASGESGLPNHVPLCFFMFLVAVVLCCRLTCRTPAWRLQHQKAGSTSFSSHCFVGKRPPNRRNQDARKSNVIAEDTNLVNCFFLFFFVFLLVMLAC